jgi:hypothetical protein
MRATLMYGAGDVRVGDVPDSTTSHRRPGPHHRVLHLW